MIETEETLNGFIFRGTNYGTVALGKNYSEDLLVGSFGVIKKDTNPKFKIIDDELNLSYLKSNGKKNIISLGKINGGKKFIEMVNENLLF